MITINQYFLIHERSFYANQFCQDYVFRKQLAETIECFLKSEFLKLKFKIDEREL